MSHRRSSFRFLDYALRLHCFIAVFDITEADGSMVENPRKLESLTQVSELRLNEAVALSYECLHSPPFFLMLSSLSFALQMLSADHGSGALLGEFPDYLECYNHALPSCQSLSYSYPRLWE